MTYLWPNQSPEPTAVGAGSSAVAVHAVSRRVAQLFSLGHHESANYQDAGCSRLYIFVGECDTCAAVVSPTISGSWPGWFSDARAGR